MSSDRELMALAAKAVGGVLSEGCGKRRTGPTWDQFEWCGGPGIQTTEGVVIRPLQDSGKALELAVKLHIDLKFYDDYVVAWFDGGFIGTGRIYYGGDPAAATRLAIAHAAAEIGKAMP